jgi:N-carbamoylputrescine amidase
VRPITVGLAQFGSPPGDAHANRAASVDVARRLFRDGANVVVLPELCVPWYASDRSAIESVAETLEGATVEAWTSIAAAHSGIVVGGLCERDGDDLFNTAVAVDETGVIAHYRKLHLFASEKNCFSPGDRGLPVVSTPFGRLGLCICYDLRFVEVVRVLALMDTDIICVPTAWLPGFDAAKWDSDGLCPQAHGALFQANLNQVFIACASQVGTFDGVEFLGSSLMADPFGKRVAGPLSGTEDSSELVHIDLDEIARAKDRGSLIQPREDRRTDVYGIAYKGLHL